MNWLTNIFSKKSDAPAAAPKPEKVMLHRKTDESDSELFARLYAAFDQSLYGVTSFTWNNTTFDIKTSDNKEIHLIERDSCWRCYEVSQYNLGELYQKDALPRLTFTMYTGREVLEFIDYLLHAGKVTPVLSSAGRMITEFGFTSIWEKFYAVSNDNTQIIVYNDVREKHTMPYLALLTSEVDADTGLTKIVKTPITKYTRERRHNKELTAMDFFCNQVVGYLDSIDFTKNYTVIESAKSHWIKEYAADNMRQQIERSRFVNNHMTDILSRYKEYNECAKKYDIIPAGAITDYQSYEDFLQVINVRKPDGLEEFEVRNFLKEAGLYESKQN